MSDASKEIRYMRSGSEMLDFLERHACSPREIPFTGEWEYEVRFTLKLREGEEPPSFKEAVLDAIERGSKR